MHLNGRSSVRFAGLLLLAALLPACASRAGGTLNPTVAPGIPTGVQGVGAPRRAVLSWTRNPAATAYTVRRSVRSGGPYLEVPGGSDLPAPAFKDGGLVDGTPYYYVVTASNRFGTSPPSVEVKVTPGFKAVQVAGGDSYSAAVMKDGSVWAWGSNLVGQIGIPTSQRQSLIALEIPIPVPVLSIACGQDHVLALSADGRVWAWGDNERGQLGNSLGAMSTVPTEVAGLSDVTAVSAGPATSLALLADGTVRAWGANAGGQPGVDTSAPVSVPGLTGITSISAGGGCNFAVTSGGSVLGWGSTDPLMLGTGTLSPPFGVPVPVANLSGIVSVSAGSEHALAVDVRGQVWAWGANFNGEIGSGTLDDAPYRVNVASLTNIVAVAAGDRHSLAVQSDGTVWAWGYSGSGALGVPPDPVLPYDPLPVRTEPLPPIVACAAGWEHSLALGADGTVFGWGDNTDGELGNGGGGAQPKAVPIRDLDSAADVSARNSRALALRSDGTVWAWGTSLVGEAGDGSSGVAILDAPVRAAGLSDITAVGAALDASMALMIDGTVWTWGNNTYGFLGSGSFTPDHSTLPAQVPNLDGVTAIAAGDYHAMALVGPDGQVWCWGANFIGQLGNGTETDSSAPVAVSVDPSVPTPLTGVIAISGGGGHSLALRADGTVWAWGTNFEDELATPFYPGGRFVAGPVDGLSGIMAISAGRQHSLALQSNGTVWAWGDNHQGQCGVDPTTLQELNTPAAIPGLTGVRAIAACGLHSLAVKSDGTVWAWGSNSTGQLGDGTFVDSFVPVQVLGLTNMLKVSGGYSFSLSVSATGLVYGWGSNESGQLTVSPTNSAFQPIPITH